MHIPKRFKVLGQQIEVGYDKTLLKTRDAIGYNNLQGEKILLQPPNAADNLTRRAVEHTFCHELVHIILMSMEERELAVTEKFVDVFGGLLHQALTTSEGELTP